MIESNNKSKFHAHHIRTKQNYYQTINITNEMNLEYSNIHAICTCITSISMCLFVHLFICSFVHSFIQSLNVLLLFSYNESNILNVTKKNIQRIYIFIYLQDVRIMFIICIRCIYVNVYQCDAYCFWKSWSMADYSMSRISWWRCIFIKRFFFSSK